MEYNELEKQWAPLIHKFSYKYIIPGYDAEDLAQELRLVLHRADKLFDPNKGTKFITYLYAAFNAKLITIHRNVQGRQKHVPAKMVSYIPEGIDFIHKEEPNYENIDLFTGLSFEATRLSELVLSGKEEYEEWLDAGMTKKNIRTGLIELQEALRGGQK
jgi:RNA polymerase sigma factor (sigma-70 family)